MVKKIALFFAYLMFFILALIYFSPKSSTYYLLESKLEPLGVVISSEVLKDSGFSLNIEDAKISFKSIDSATVGFSEVKIFGIYNSLSLFDIRLSTTAKTFLPLKIKSAKVTYSILHPLSIRANARGVFGSLEANFNIIDTTLRIVVVPSQKMLKNYKSSLKNLKKDDNGGYVYDKSF